jgi:hypothetical protein
MKIEKIDSLNKMREIKEAWNELLDNAISSDVLYSFEWYYNWISSFANCNKINIVTVQNNSGISTIIPLIEDKIRIKKIPVNILKSPTNLQSTRFDLITKSISDEICKGIDYAFKSSGRNIMILDLVPENSAIRNYLINHKTVGKHKYLIKYRNKKPLIEIKEPFEVFYKALNSKFRKNVNAAERKALVNGEINLCFLKDEEDLESFLTRGYQLEASGWKGNEGTAIINDTNTKDFYSNVANAFHKKDWLQLFLLTNNNKDISFYYCVGSYGVVRALKIGVNAESSNIAPGMLITKYALDHIFETENTFLWDFCGKSARWKNDWSNSEESYFKVYIFSNNIIGKLFYGIFNCYDILNDYFKTFKRGVSHA